MMTTVIVLVMNHESLNQSVPTKSNVTGKTRNGRTMLLRVKAL